jgi:zinc protease
VQARELPMVQLRVVFDAASQRDPADKHGLASLTAALLREGTGALTADDVAHGFEGLGAEFGAGADREMATVSLRSLTDPKLLEPALDLAARLLAAPSFPVDSLERERARVRVALSQEKQNPSVTIQRAFMQALYGDHPYAAEPVGDEAGVQAITRDDVVAHHRRYYTGRNALIVLVGNLSGGEARQVAQRVLGRLPAGEPAPPTPAVMDVGTRDDSRDGGRSGPSRPSRGTTPSLEGGGNAASGDGRDAGGRATQGAAAGTAVEQTIPFPITQSHIRLGQPGIARLDPDYFPLLVGNYTLGGGGLVSRLSVEVREQRGLSYSVYSYFHPMRERGPFTLGLQTRNESRHEALAVVRRVLADFIAHGPTDEELEAAKKHLTGSFPLRLDSSGKIADQVAGMAFYRLPLSYLDDYIPNVRKVTRRQVQDAFRRHLAPERMVTVVVGGKK